jgi:hypothetical protein
LKGSVVFTSMASANSATASTIVTIELRFQNLLLTFSLPSRC